MKGVVSINGRKFLGSYIDARNNERIPDEVFFGTGAFLTVVLPQLICSAYGLLPITVFAGTALAGSLWGAANYFRQPPAAPSLTGTRTVPQAPPGEYAVAEDRDAA